MNILDIQGEGYHSNKFFVFPAEIRKKKDQTI